MKASRQEICQADHDAAKQQSGISRSPVPVFEKVARRDIEVNSFSSKRRRPEKKREWILNITLAFRVE
jgi:hypothetical protein